jgi:hypothetical protein
MVHLRFTDTRRFFAANMFAQFSKNTPSAPSGKTITFDPETNAWYEGRPCGKTAIPGT